MEMTYYAQVFTALVSRLICLSISLGLSSDGAEMLLSSEPLAASAAGRQVHTARPLLSPWLRVAVLRPRRYPGLIVHPSDIRFPGSDEGDGAARRQGQGGLLRVHPGLLLHGRLHHVLARKIRPSWCVSRALNSMLSLLTNADPTGLAETLQSEFMLYGIDVHIAFPGTIHSPGLEEENQCKPKITLKLEETDEGATPAVVAKAIVDGTYFSVYP